MAIRAILLDTNAYAAFRRNEPDAVEVMKYAPAIVLNVVVLGEMLSGFAAGRREAANQQELKRFLDSKRVSVISLDEGSAEQYAVVYRMLRSKGQPIPTNDMWVAASALQHRLAVFTYDGHFRVVDGLISGNQLAHFLV